MIKYLNQLKGQRALIISLGKILSSFAGMALPMYLARAMTVEDYGSYKQIILFWMIGLQILGLGIDHGLFYFVGKDPKKAALYSINVFLFNLIIASCFILISTPLISSFSGVINNPRILECWWPMATIILASLPGQHFEHFLMLLDKPKSNILVQVMTESCKSLVILLTYYFTKNLSYSLWGVAGLYGLRSLILLAFNFQLLKQHSKFPSMREMLDTTIDQFKFGRPMGISKISLAFMGLDKFIISSILGLKNFTFYAIGTMDLPFVPGVAYTYLDSMGMNMMATPGNLKARLLILQDTFKKVFHILLIPACFVWVFAEDFILLFYGNKFNDASPLLRLHLLNFVIIGLDFEIVYRVFNKSKKMMVLYSSYVFFTLLIVWIGSLMGNLIYPLIGKIICSLFYVMFIFKDFSHFFNIKLAELINWPYFFKNSLYIIIAALISYLLSTQLPPIPVFFKILSIGIFYLVLIWLFILRVDPGIVREHSATELMGVVHES